MSGEEGVSSNVHDSSPSASGDLMSNTNANSSRLPAGPTCFTVRRGPHHVRVPCSWEKQVDVLISKNQVLQILYFKHHVFKTS